MLRMVRNTLCLLLLVGLLACWSTFRGQWNKAAVVVQDALEQVVTTPAPADLKPVQPLPPGYSTLSRAYEQIQRMGSRQPNE